MKAATGSRQLILCLISLLDHIMLSPGAKQKIQEHIAAMPDDLRCEPAMEEELCGFKLSYGSIPED